MIELPDGTTFREGSQVHEKYVLAIVRKLAFQHGAQFEACFACPPELWTQPVDYVVVGVTLKEDDSPRVMCEGACPRCGAGRTWTAGFIDLNLRVVDLAWQGV